MALKMFIITFVSVPMNRLLRGFVESLRSNTDIFREPIKFYMRPFIKDLKHHGQFETDRLILYSLLALVK